MRVLARLAAAALTCAVTCYGCGSPHDTPDLSKGPPVSELWQKKAKDFAAKKAAAKPAAKGRAKSSPR
jgi:hypothetical protein